MGQGIMYRLLAVLTMAVVVDSERREGMRSHIAQHS